MVERRLLHDRFSHRPLLRWNDHVIAQTTGEEQDGCMDAYQALVGLVRAAVSLPVEEQQ